MKSEVFACSVHTHSKLCDGKNSPEEMAEAACAAGIKHLGFSGHVHTAIDYDEGNVLPCAAENYRARCAALKAQYAGKMEILTGIEWDSCSDETVPEGLDYWIGSVHNLRGRSGKYYSVDWTREMFLACRDEEFGGNVYAMLEAYFAEVKRVAAMKPTILGHIDLVTKLNGDGSLFDETEERYRAAALAALESADSFATLLEINTGAVARGYRSEPYPALFLLERWRERGGRIIITSDAHSAEGLVFGYEEAMKLAKCAGYESAAILTAAGIKDCLI